VRQFTEHLCQPLVVEDYVIQAMPDVSPPKWHLAHTSWFFETFVLASASSTYRSPHDAYAYLFNSYYVGAGERHCRPKRGLLSRPTVEEVYRYRTYVDLSACSQRARGPGGRGVQVGQLSRRYPLDRP
jgi:hypothetical protein